MHTSWSLDRSERLPGKNVTLFADRRDARTSDGTGAAATFSYPAGAVVLEPFSMWRTRAIDHPQDRYWNRSGLHSRGCGGDCRLVRITGRNIAALLPSGAITTDGGANLYVADSGDNVIVRVVAATGVVTTVAGTPVWRVPRTRPARARKPGIVQSNPLGITLAAENLYVRLRQRHDPQGHPGGTVTTVAGNAAAQGFADGTGPAQASSDRTGSRRTASISTSPIQATT